MPQFEGEITDILRYGQGTLLSISADIPSAEPGQFAHLLCGDDAQRVLRRPFSIMDCGDRVLTILVKVVGGGTAWLADRKAGERLDGIAPLGKGFNLNAFSKPLLVAGGTGVAPIHFLARSLAAVLANAPKLLWGLNCGEDFGKLPAKIAGELDVELATCDGSAGLAGTAVDLLERELAGGEYDGIFACGPQPMLTALRPLLERYRLPCQVSVEQRMACGIGACYGCAVRRSGPQEAYLRACLDGPVFDYTALAWSGPSLAREAGE